MNGVIEIHLSDCGIDAMIGSRELQLGTLVVLEPSGQSYCYDVTFLTTLMVSIAPI